MDFNYFLTDNKSGHKTKEQWFSKNHLEEYKKIIDYSLNINLELNFKEKIWFYFNKLTERPKCCTCGGEIKFRNRFDKPYGEFCKLECINNNQDEMIKRQKETFQKKYGINFYPEHEDFLKKQFKTKQEKYGDGNYNNMNKNRQTKLERYNDSNYINIEKTKQTNLKRYGVEYHAKSQNFKNIIEQKFRKLYSKFNIVKIDNRDLVVKCNLCNEDYEITKQCLYERHNANYIVCTKCNPLGFSIRSGKENEIALFLDELNIKHQQSNRKILDGKEVDFYLPDNQIAIEYNGLYWHNELFLDDKYHLNKTNLAKEKNIDLIHIFEDEWLYRKEIVKSILKNKLNKTDNVIYGRKCIIKEVDSKTSKLFLNENHIQGFVNSSVRLGLYYNNNLVSLMTFSKGRILMGGKDDEWELNRFCNILNTNVIGGASKLLKHFIKINNNSKIISYSDVRMFNGGMYEQLGFQKIHQSPPNYWYVKNDVRYHRFGFRKDILIKEGFNPNKTEREIMLERKIYRIYDCGNIRWEYQNN